VVIASGFSRAKPMEEAQQLAAGPFIRKPHGPQRLGSAVRRELERAMDS
jgi:hypothetical protein